MTVANTDKVTPSEYVALVQVSDSNSQPLILTGTGEGTGVASGGTFSLADSNVPGGGFQAFNLPTGVTMNASAQTPLTYSGSFTNGGTINFSGASTSVSVSGEMQINGPINFNAASTTVFAGGDASIGIKTTAPITFSAASPTISSKNPIDLQGTVTFNGTGTATVSSPTSITIEANVSAAGNLVLNANGGLVSIQNNSLTIAQGTLTLTGDGQVSVLDTSVAKGTSVFINTAFNPSGSLTVDGTIQSGSGADDATVVTSNNALTVVGTGQWINPTALTFTAIGTLDLSGSTAPTLTNNLTLTATGGTLKLPSNQLTVSTDATGDGGTITIIANSITPIDTTKAINFTADATGTGTGTGTGGTISVTLANGGVTIGGAANQLNFSAQGGTTSGGGGTVTVSNTGDLIVNPANINLLTVGGDGGKMFLTAGAAPGQGTLTINSGGLSADGVGGGNGGEISVFGTFISFGDPSIPLTFSANGNGTGSGGKVTYSTNGSNQLNLKSTVGATLGDVSISAQSGTGGGSGGIITVNNGAGNINFTAVNANPQNPAADGNGGQLTLSTTGTINVPSGTLAMNGTGNGKGGLISLTGKSIAATGTGAIALEANAAATGSGSGGTIILNSGAPTPFTVGAGNGNVTLTATAGNGGSKANPTTGGSVSVSAAGNLIVDATKINVSSGSGAGSGGSITLAGGTGPNGGTLVVSGTLDASASGSTGTGGSITLQSNSKTAFALDSAKTTNGTQTVLNIAGTSGQTDGIVSVTNIGAGGINDLELLTAVSQVTFSTASSTPPVIGANGPILINAALGGANTNLITLEASGTGKVTEGTKFAITANTLDVFSRGSLPSPLPSSTFTLPNVVVGDISANTGTKGTVAITNLTPNFINIDSGAAGTFTVKSIGFISTLGNITAGAITLQDTSKTAFSGSGIEIDSNVAATTGNLTLSTLNSILVDPGALTSAAKALLFTVSGATSTITINGTVNTTSSAGTVALIAAKSTAVGGSIIGGAGSDISANKSVTITAYQR